jgi:HAD superfamily hydrolase (TIGR01490 family)
MATTKRNFAVFDLDGTLVRWQLYHAVFDHLALNKSIDEKVHQSVKEARLSWKRRQSDFRAYELILIRAYLDTLGKLTTKETSQAVEAAFEEHKEQVYTYTKDLIKDLKAKNYVLLAISGSHNEIVERIAKYYGFEDWIGTFYEHKSGKYTGSFTFSANRKDVRLKEFINKHNLTLEGSVAVGDSEGDIPMLEMVEQPIAFNPAKLLYEHAKKKGWPIVLERKNVIYQLAKNDSFYTLQS